MNRIAFSKFFSQAHGYIVPAFRLMLIFLIVIVLISGNFSSVASAQDLSKRPVRVGEVVAALDDASWQKLEDGLSGLLASSALGTKITALRISPKKFSLAIASQKSRFGNNAEEFAGFEEAAIAINGGFFARKDDGSLFPVGQLIIDGKKLSSAWRRSGGHLVLNAEGADIIPSGKTLPVDNKNSLQSRPVIVEAGGRWALRQNLNILANRSLVCLLPSKDIILLAISGRGMSLYDAGWLLRGRMRGGWIGCDTAMALDGGSSTQLYYDRNSAYSLKGGVPVNNALIIKRRATE